MTHEFPYLSPIAVSLLFQQSSSKNGVSFEIFVWQFSFTLNYSSDIPMVGLPREPMSSPVACAHLAMCEPGATVARALAALNPPPLASIPHLTSTGVRPGDWVRYTAMVQDIWDPEMFVAKSPDGRSGLLIENAAASTQDGVVLAERLPVYLVSIPGESPWASSAPLTMPTPTLAPSPSSAQGRLKRTRSDVELSENPGASTVPQSGEGGPSMAAVSTARPPLPPVHSQSSDKRSKPSDEGFRNVSAVPSVIVGLNTPVPHQTAASAVVAKLYDVSGDRASCPPLNTVIEVVGILQEGIEVGVTSHDAFTAELIARNPRNVMRLHVVQWRSLSVWELNPIAARLGAGGVRGAATEVRQVAPSIRRTLIEYFQGAVLGDALAAEYLLLALLSKPIRQGQQLLGKLSVNFVLPPSESDAAAKHIMTAIQNVCSSMVQIDVSIASMNSREVYARKDYELNRLRAGSLQVAEGSCLLINETSLSHGQLADRGVRNLRALKSVAERGVAPVDFHYYESEIDARHSTVLLSTGGKSVIGSDVVFRVCGDSQNRLTLDDWKQKWLCSDMIDRLRLAVTLLAEDGVFNISDGVGEEVSRTFVDARRMGRARDGQECLQRWLAVARSCARSFGERELTSERWRYVMEVELVRDNRLGTVCS